MAFEYQTTLKLHDTDAAGILFFGNQFKIAHDAYQAFMEAAGFSFADVLAAGEILVPIVHAEADYLAPLVVGDHLNISVRSDGISEHSFTLAYELRREPDTPVGTARTVHVTIDRATGKKTPVPAALREALSGIAS